MKMKNYLSFGGGVNSVALYLHLLDAGLDFEAIFVDHGADWPETYKYVNAFAEKYPLTILKASMTRKKSGKTFSGLIDHCRQNNIIPQQWPRWCTGDWKKNQINRYIDPPCFMNIGIDAGEARRAKISSVGNIEYRYPLVEAGIDRDGCKALIAANGLAIPPKSGCYICPFQSPAQLRELRIKHPELFCVVKQLEKNSGRTLKRGVSVSQVINENQMPLFKDDEYPPCLCDL